jgi:hypothetical protein
VRCGSRPLVMHLAAHKWCNPKKMHGRGGGTKNDQHRSLFPAQRHGFVVARLREDDEDKVSFLPEPDSIGHKLRPQEEARCSLNATSRVPGCFTPS